MVTEATAHAITAEYHHSTLIGIPIYSSHSGTALYEFHVVSQEESGRVEISQRLARIQPIQVSIDMVGIFSCGKLSLEGLTIMQHCTPGWGTHKFGRMGMCCSNGSLFYKKFLNMGPVFLPKNP